MGAHPANVMATNQGAINLLRGRWTALLGHLSELSVPLPTPNDPWTVFQLANPGIETGDIAVEVKPVLFNVRERASFSGRPSLYVVARGTLVLERATLGAGRIRIVGFSTEVGYFRLTKDASLEHVYGTHYDFAVDQIGHPIFHGQVKSFSSKFLATVEDAVGPCPSVDRVEGILERVRMPTAQMDFFSLILQICADHYFSDSMDEETRLKIRALLETSRTMEGAGFKRTPTSNVECMRAGHWYSAPPAPL